jgi:lysozyme
MWLLLLLIFATGILFLAKATIASAEEYADGENEDQTQQEVITPYNPMNDERNLYAFLKLIRVAESQDNYNALVGGGDFTDYSDHPANLGWSGIRLGVGLTTAAGAYQITSTTWDGGGWKPLRSGVKQELGLTDFSPASQDAAAIALLQRRGAYDLVLAGDFESAIRKLTGEWEAFEKMIDGTYPITLADARNIYQSGGGEFS